VSLLTILSLASLYLVLLERLQPSKITGGDLAKDPPAGVEYWQLRLLQAMMGEKNITLKDLRDYSYRWDKEANSYVSAKPRLLL
jgi:hypothetical protein